MVFMHGQTSLVAKRQINRGEELMLIMRRSVIEHAWFAFAAVQ